MNARAPRKASRRRPAADEAASLGPCPICGRPMVDGPGVDRHHWLPRSHGGRDAAALHVVCHRMIHEVFTDAQLAAGRTDAEAIRADPAIRKFVAWVRRKPPGFVDWPRSPRKR